MNDANKIINFVKSNQFLQDGLLEVNPFVFNQNGIGITMDGAYSYNKELSNLLCTFLSLRKDKNIVSAPTTLEFANFVLNVINNTNDQDLLKIYNFIYTNLTKDNLSLNDFCELVNHYQGNKELLIKALQTTKQKYGDEHMLTALVEMINGNFSYVTNDYHLRNNSKTYLMPDTIKSIINEICGYNKDREIDFNTLVVLRGRINQLDENKQKKKSNEIVPSSIKTLIYATCVTVSQSGYEESSFNEIITNFLYSYDERWFTRKNNARELVRRTFEGIDIRKKLIEDLGLSYDANISVIVNAINEIYNLNKGIKKK